MNDPNNSIESLKSLSRSMHMPEVPSIPGSILNPARWMHERLVRSINEFEQHLDSEHEVGARLVNFGTNCTIAIDDVGYWGPDIVIFHGQDQNGEKVELLQHVSQMSVLLMAIEKTHEKPRRIGFDMVQRLESEDA